MTVKESGPLVASLLVESDAPGCVKLSREFRVVDGLDRVDIINVLDKNAVRREGRRPPGLCLQRARRRDADGHPLGGHASRNRPDSPARARTGSTVGRWVDVSNRELGVTWATVDAPMVLVGAITADRIGSLPNPNDWLDHVGAVPDALLDGDEQPLVHELQGRPGRPDDVPL